MTDLDEVVRRRLGIGLRSSAPLKGGVSAEVQHVLLEDGRAIVVRTPPFGTGAREHALHDALARRGLPVPPPLFVDGNTWAMELVQGAAEPDDRLLGARAMADLLARLHAAELDGVDLPEREDPRAELLSGAWPIDDELRARLERSSYTPTTRALLHGDYWPGNLLWQGNQIAALLDWEDAAVGDPLSDLAAARCELQVAWGDDATEAFTARYLERTHLDTTHLPLWEIFVSTTALAVMSSWGLAPEDEAARRATTEAFLSASRRGWSAR